MPTNEALGAAVKAAIRDTNEGYQNTNASAAIFTSDGTVADMSARMRGTLLKGASGGHDFYWWVPAGPYKVVASIGSTAQHKLMIVKGGNATATGGPWCKPAELSEVTHGIRGVPTHLPWQREICVYRVSFRYGLRPAFGWFRGVGIGFPPRA